MKKDNIPINMLIDSVVHPVDKPKDLTSGLPYATHEGVLEIGGIKLEVAVLNDGRRIFCGDEAIKLLKEIIRGQ